MQIRYTSINFFYLLHYFANKLCIHSQMTHEFFVFISHAEAVGMHHLGPKRLNVGVTYVLRADITNVTVWRIEHNTVLQFYTLLFNNSGTQVKSLFIYNH